MKKKGLLLKIIIICSIVYIAFFDKASFVQVFKSKMRYKKLKNESERIARENENLRNKNEKLKNDPFEWERIAREKLGMQKEGENVYRFYNDKDEKK